MKPFSDAVTARKRFIIEGIGLLEGTLWQPINVEIIAASDLLLQRKVLTLQATAHRFKRTKLLRQVRSPSRCKLLERHGLFELLSVADQRICRLNRLMDHLVM